MLNMNFNLFFIFTVESVESISVESPESCETEKPKPKKISSEESCDIGKFVIFCSSFNYN